MVEMTVNDFFEDEEDDFFANAFRSISEIESSSSKSSLSVVSQVDNSAKNISVCNIISDNKELNNSINCFEGERQNTKNLTFSDCEGNTEIASRAVAAVQNVISSDSRECDKINEIDHRFFPGFTPKTKKRKFAGPAGDFIEDLEQYLPSTSGESVLKKISSEDAELQTISSSQISSEELLQTLSWKKLQDDVSSNYPLHSTVKFYSIQRVLHDTAKKKLPKHIVVPILCVYLKKFSHEEPVSIYMDDTGEINGKIDKDVLEEYGKYLESGAALVLRKITFVCNVMILEKSNLVSIYLADGSVKHVQNWDSDIEKETSKNRLNCVCPLTPNLKKKPEVNRQSLPRKSTTALPNKSPNIFCQSKLSLPPPHIVQSSTPQNNSVKSPDNVSTSSLFATEDTEDACMDEFDILIGNLDEQSFLEDF